MESGDVDIPLLESEITEAKTRVFVYNPCYLISDISQTIHYLYCHPACICEYWNVELSPKNL